MKRLAIAATAAALMLAAAPQLHAQATRKPDSTARKHTTSRSAAARPSSVRNGDSSAVKVATKAGSSTKHTGTKSKKSRRAKAKADSAKKGT